MIDGRWCDVKIPNSKEGQVVSPATTACCSITSYTGTASAMQGVRGSLY